MEEEKILKDDDPDTKIVVQKDIGDKKNFVWPLIVFGGMVLAHPWNMVAMRV